jgi:hypothetical protein
MLSLVVSYCRIANVQAQFSTLPNSVASSYFQRIMAPKKGPSEVENLDQEDEVQFCMACKQKEGDQDKDFL